MKQAEVLELMRNGQEMIVDWRLHSTAQIGMKPVRFDTFLSLRNKDLIKLGHKSKTSLLEYYVLNG